jgi:NADPH:quinone reductase-like Zn-dependent oxidoreductase
MLERMAADVTDFRIGDEVYGLADFPRDGAAAEFAAVPAIKSGVEAAQHPSRTGRGAAAFGADSLAGTLRTCATCRGTKRADPRRRCRFLGSATCTLARRPRNGHGVSRDTAFVHSLGADIVVDYHAMLFEDTLRHSKDYDSNFRRTAQQLQKLRVMRPSITDHANEIFRKFGSDPEGQ